MKKSQVKNNTEVKGPSTKLRAGKTLNGVVFSSKMQDTIVVTVMRFVKHPKYKKYYKVSKKYKVHNPGNTAKVGDKVEIRETKPISKDKHFILVS